MDIESRFQAHDYAYRQNFMLLSSNALSVRFNYVFRQTTPSFRTMSNIVTIPQSDEKNIMQVRTYFQPKINAKINSSDDLCVLHLFETLFYIQVFSFIFLNPETFCFFL